MSINDSHRDKAIGTFQIATQCSDHRNESINEGELGDLLYYGDNEPADEFESVAVFIASEGSGYIVAAESSDHTGHGCQCDGRAERFDTIVDALRLGLSPDEAALCGATEARNQAIKEFTQSEG